MGKLTEWSYRGTLKAMGQSYGVDHDIALRGFLQTEFDPVKRRSQMKFARECLPWVEQHTPKFLQFITGIAATSQLTIEELVLLSCHEEIVHNEHCSAVMSGALLGQNWDWQAALFPWPSLLRLETRMRKTLTYQYPGLYSCCGLNDAGLGLMWTGAGYYPAVKSKPGIPTYALLFEIFQMGSIRSVRRLLEKEEHAGCFLFLVTSRDGKSFVVEGIPQKVEFEETRPVHFRANHFEIPSIVRGAKQGSLPASKTNSKARGRELAGELSDRTIVSRRKITDLLTRTPQIYKSLTDSTTIDSLVADTAHDVLWYARHGKKPKWHQVSL